MKVRSIIEGYQSGNDEMSKEGAVVSYLYRLIRDNHIVTMAIKT